MIIYYQESSKQEIQYKLSIHNKENECYKRGYFE